MALVPLLLALGLLGFAAWLFTRAREVETNAEAITRVRSAGVVAAEGDTPLPTQREVDNSFVRWCVQLLWRAGAQSDSAIVVRMLMGLFAIVLLLLLIGGPIFGPLMAGAALLLLYGVLAVRAARRRALIVQQMPGFLENTIRVLAAGNSLEESLAVVARDSPQPIATVFASVARQVRLGAPLDQVLADAGEVYRVRDLKVIALAATINRRYGGSLRNVMKSLIQAIRNRAAAARELRALTAETRFSALVLSVLPVGLTSYIYFINRNYYHNILVDPVGRLILLGSALLILIGIFVIWRMMRSTEDAPE